MKLGTRMFHSSYPVRNKVCYKFLENASSDRHHASFFSVWNTDMTAWAATAALRSSGKGQDNCSNLSPAAAASKSLQSCPTLCDPIDGSPPGSPVPGILQARTLEWVAISFSNAWKWKVKVKALSRVRLSATPWTAAHQAPPSMGFSRQECWSGVPLPSPKSEFHLILKRK